MTTRNNEHTDYDGHTYAERADEWPVCECCGRAFAEVFLPRRLGAGLVRFPEPRPESAWGAAVAGEPHFGACEACAVVVVMELGDEREEEEVAA